MTNHLYYMYQSYAKSIQNKIRFYLCRLMTMILLNFNLINLKGSDDERAGSRKSSGLSDAHGGKPGGRGGRKSGNLGGVDDDGPTLHVELIKAKNLIKSDLIGKSDPYAVLKYGNQSDKTKVVKNNLNPQWDHASDFDMDLGDNENLM